MKFEKIKQALEKLKGEEAEPGRYCKNPEEHIKKEYPVLREGIIFSSGDPHCGCNICLICLKEILKDLEDS